MTRDLPTFAELVTANFQAIARTPHVFVVALDGDTLYAQYLAAFPDGSNPIFRTRTEHDCSTCRQFIRRVGNVVAVGPVTISTIWDTAAVQAPYPYNVVAMRLRELVLGSPISDLFRVGVTEEAFGADQTLCLDKETQQVQVWHHLCSGAIPSNLRTASPDQVRGDYRTTVQVFERGLTELSPDAVETVRSLIEANSLYRGAEHMAAVSAFQKTQEKFLALPEHDRSVFVWVNAGGPSARFRNTVIGTLVQDLSEGRDLESAVQSFEAKVAPQSYKRTTALITPSMVKKAMETIQSLGLESALERRLAVMADISVTDVKWVDGAVKPLMKGDLGDALMQYVMKGQPALRQKLVEEAISLDDFMDRVVPTMTGMEILFQGEFQSNLMVLTAPVHPEPKQLFRWNNDFAWSYNGNVADSIKERVKRAGGQVEGVALRVSLSWFNYDDLDLHIHEPARSGLNSLYQSHIHFRNKRGWTGGVLDVDMNAGYSKTREPVENVVWKDKMPDGDYRIVINNFSLRETNNVGFVVELESNGKVSRFSYNKGVRQSQDIHVVTLYIKDGGLKEWWIGDPSVSASNISQEVWGLTTERYVKVNAITLSPNYWGENKVGNKHAFFILEGCKCEEPMRGIYNEFLHPRLEQHRKVFELVGDKTKCLPSENQVAGLGFSSTKPAYFVAHVRQGKKQRLFNVRVS